LAPIEKFKLDYFPTSNIHVNSLKLLKRISLDDLAQKEFISWNLLSIALVLVTGLDFVVAEERGISFF